VGAAVWSIHADVLSTGWLAVQRVGSTPTLPFTTNKPLKLRASCLCVCLMDYYCKGTCQVLGH